HAARRGGGRSRRAHLAAPVWHGEGPLLPPDLGLPGREGGRAYRTGESLRAAGGSARKGLGGGGQARGRQPGRGPVEEAVAEQLAASGWAHLRPEPGSRDALVHGTGRARGRAGDSRETRPSFSVGPLATESRRRQSIIRTAVPSTRSPARSPRARFAS